VDTKVIDRHRDGLGRRVRLFVDAKVRKVDYVLHYHYDRPHRIWWDFVEGNGINDVDGEYVFEELGGQRTRATYRLGIEPGLPIPGPVARRVHKQTMKRSVEDLKREAERRHASGVSPSKPRRRLPFSREPELEPTEERPAEPAASETGLGSVTALPGAVLRRVASTGRGVAGAGGSAAGAAIGAGREVAGAGVSVARKGVGAVAGLAGRLVGRGERSEDKRD
jgi:hypothetical protein